MSLSEKEKFTFTWQIQNFSMCPQKFKEGIDSPEFVVHTLKESEWKLKLYPNGCEKEGTVSCYLCCTNAGYYIEDVQVGFRFTFPSIDNSIICVSGNNSFMLRTGLGYAEFKKSDVLKDEAAYLPYDTLTLKCSLWREDNSDILKEEIAIASQGYLENSEKSSECSVLTRNPVQRKTVFWPVRSFSSIGSNRITKCVISALKDVPSFRLTLYKSNDDGKVLIEIRKLKTKSEKQMLAKCKISVIHFPTSDNSHAVDKYFFVPCANNKNDDVWTFPTFLDLNTLEENRYFYRTFDVLILGIEFTFSHLGNQCHVCKDSVVNEFKFFKNVSHALDCFGHLYKSGEMSDAKLRAGDKEFKVHQMILKARSSVFRTMFEKDMKEKKIGVVNIDDVDPETLDRMLTFLYTNAIEDVQLTEAIRLYFAAEKYEVLPLKLRCTCMLESMLSVGNVCEVLNLADQHHDEALFNSAELFVRSNSVEIFKSKDWEGFMESNLTVAAKVMHKCLVH